MNWKNILRRVLPYLVSVVVFGAVSVWYFAPQFSGKTLQMTDVQMYEGMKKDISEHRAAFDEDPQWTGGMFGGMPAYLITVQYPAMFLRNGAQWCMNLLGEPAALMFLAMLGFWLMLLMTGVNPWIAIAPAIAYGLSTYNILIIEAGHITKMRAMGYAPMLAGAVFYTFRRTGKVYGPWLGGGLAALFGALTIGASHHQITYYFLLVVIAYWINRLVVAAREKGSERVAAIRRFGKSTAILVAAAALAVGANFTHLWYTFEHSPETIRGGSEITASVGAAGVDSAGDSVNTSQGLDLEYATAWSYGIGETLNLFIPNFRGGGSSVGFDVDGEVADVLRRSGITPSVATELPGYWGDQPFTGGPTYIGAVVVFLSILGMFVLPGRKKWWVFGVSLLGLLLAWGSNAMWFTELSFAILPGYNKFRTVSMALVILQWSLPFIAALVLSSLWNRDFSGPEERKKFMRGFWWSLGIAGGVALFFALFGGMIYDFSAASDEQLSGVPGLVDAVRSERASMLKADSWRSLMFVAMATAAVWAFANIRSIKRWMFASAIGVLVLADLVPVDWRYLSHDDFHTPSRVEIVPDDADRAIMADGEPGFRVLNTQNPFNEAFTSYFHRSIGGYHGAKLRRYQDVIDRYLSKFDMGVLNMLNTKYFIVADPETGERLAQLNPDANGAAWMVDEVFFVDGAREELEALGTIDNKHEVVVDKRFEELIVDADIASVGDPADNEAGVELVEYRPNYLKYETLSTGERVVVFSEIYYDKGWTAYIDGESTPYFRADYVLRGMMIPAGTHTVEWRFRAPHFTAVEGVTLACSIVILLWLVVTLILDWRRRPSSTGENGQKQSKNAQKTV